MKIKGGNRRSWLWAIIFIVFILLIVLYTIKPTSDSIPVTQSYFCGAEKIEGIHFVSNNELFNNAKCQNDSKSFSGKYACLCDPNQIYGMGYNISDLSSGDTIIYSIRRYPESGPGALVFSSETPQIFQKKDKGQSSKKGWDLISDTIILPSSFENGRTMIYPFYTGEGQEVYFDDLNIRVKSRAGQTSISRYEGSTLGIQITEPNLKKLRAKRDEAIEKGLLFASREDLVPAKVKIDDVEYNARVRLKGDLLDHLQGKFWSYRIILRKGAQWNGMSQFSIHNSKARSHVTEWLMHEIFRREGIITPPYDFVRVNSNGDDLGVYAYEQHFENELLLNNGRQVGPILRHNEEAYWANVQKELEDFSWVRSTEIESMNQPKSAASNASELHLTGRSMLTDFVKGKRNADEVFDIELMAKYYALLNLSHANHAQLITNIRFYLNPFSGLLEPIAFDCFGSDLPKVNKEWKALGEGMNRDGEYAELYESGNIYAVELFKNDLFYEKFLEYSYLYNGPSYIDTLIAEYDEEINARKSFIRADRKYSNYNFSWETFSKKGRYTHDKLLPKPFLSLKPFYTNENENEVLLQSFHYFPLQIIGFGNDTMEYKLNEPLILEAFNNNLPPDECAIELEQSVRYVYYQTLGIDSLFKEKISRQTFKRGDFDIVTYDAAKLRQFDFLDISEDKVSFKPGDYEVDGLIAIPDSYTVQIPSGTTIRFKGSGGIISKSPIVAQGSKAQPINFLGEKNGMNGISIVGASTKSIFQHCNFSQLKAITQANVSTEGALVIYASEAELKSCTFQNITGRDALKLVNSKAIIEASEFKNCQGDGIDLNQSRMEMYSTQMDKIGQDGIEIDGGSLLANNITISNCLRFGLRAGSRSDATIYAFAVNQSENGVIASEGATVKLIGPSFNILQNGFVVESSEYLTSSIRASNHNENEVINSYQLDLSSELIINDSKKSPL